MPEEIRNLQNIADTRLVHSKCNYKQPSDIMQSQVSLCNQGVEVGWKDILVTLLTLFLI